MFAGRPNLDAQSLLKAATGPRLLCPRCGSGRCGMIRVVILRATLPANIKYQTATQRKHSEDWQASCREETSTPLLCGHSSVHLFPPCRPRSKSTQLLNRTLRPADVLTLHSSSSYSLRSTIDHIGARVQTFTEHFMAALPSISGVDRLLDDLWHSLSCSFSRVSFDMVRALPPHSFTTFSSSPAQF